MFPSYKTITHKSIATKYTHRVLKPYHHPSEPQDHPLNWGTSSIFPMWSLFSMSWWASAASDNGKYLYITGFTLPATIAGQTFFSTSLTITALFSRLLFRKPAATYSVKREREREYYMLEKKHWESIYSGKKITSQYNVYPQKMTFTIKCGAIHSSNATWNVKWKHDE